MIKYCGPIIVAVVGLGLSQAVAQNQPGTSSTPAAAAPTANQKKLLEEFTDFFDRVGQAAPGDPKGRPLSTVIREWSGQTRAIRVKTGERFETSTYPAGALRTIDVIEERQVTRIYFGTFKGKADEGTAAEYDPEFSVIKLNENMTARVEPPTTPRPKYGETNISHVFDLVEKAQTVWHEFFHTTQGRQPGTDANETATWHATLNATGEWVRRLQADYDRDRTLENARYLLATIDAWKNYYTAVDNKTELGELLKQPLPSAELAALSTLREQVFKEHQAIEVLEGLLGPPPIPGVARTLGELLEEVRASSPADLEKQLVDAARRQVDQGKLRRADAARKDQEARRQAKKALEVVQSAWEKKFAAAVAVTQKLVAFSLTISTADDEVKIDAKKGRADLTIEIDNEAAYSQLAGELARALYKACGPKGTVMASEQWKVSGRPLPASAWMGSGTKNVPIDNPGEHKIVLVRTMTIGTDLGAQGIPKTITTASNEITVKVPATYPMDIAGRWTGSFVIREIPLLEAMKEEQKNARQPGDPKRGSTANTAIGAVIEELGEGCTIPPEMFAEIVTKLEKLKGRDIPLTFDVQPDSLFAGSLTMLAKPPQDLGMTAGKPKTVVYRYAEGVITVGTVEEQMTMSMRGTFQPAATGWTLNGTWQSHVVHKGQKLLAMQGTWSGTNPNAK